MATNSRSTRVEHQRRPVTPHLWGCGAWLSFVVLMTAGPAGCSSNTPNLPPLAPVSGTITMDGQPLAGAEVVFMSPSGHPSIGATDGDGNYTLKYRGIHPGAGPGLNSVIVRSIPKDPNVPIEKEPIPAIYNSKTTLAADVAPAKSNTFNFELTSRK